MDTFRIYSHCFTNGHDDISPHKAGNIMGISTKMATNYASGKNRPDPARMRLLEATIGKKIIPQGELFSYLSYPRKLKPLF